MSTAITQVDGFLNADYEAIFQLNTSFDDIFKLFAHPRVPVFAVIAYLVLSKPLFTVLRKTFNIQPKGNFMQFITITHSAILAVYSAWTFYGTAMVAVPYILEHGFYPSLCDVDGNLWNKSGLGFWITHFYLSKIYEFIDTW
jgi:hypothetical protein